MKIRLLPLALVLLAGVLCRLLTFEEPLGCDQAAFTCIGRGLTHGLLPPRDLWDNKTLVYHVLWLPAGPLFDAGLSWGALAELFAATLAAVLLCLAASRSLGFAGGCVAALLYTLHLNGFAFGGWFTRGYPEVVLDVPLAAALALLCWSSRPVHRALAGAMLAAAVWLKPSCLPMLVLLLVMRGTGDSSAWKPPFWSAVGCALGALTPLAAIAALGVLPESWLAIVGYNAEMLVSKSAVTPVPAEWLGFVFPFANYLTALYAWAALALAARGPFSEATWLPLLWWALTVASALAQRKLFASHYIGIAAPLAWLAAAGFSHVDRRMGRRPALLVLAASLVPWTVATVQYGRQAGYVDRMLGRVDRETFQDRFRWPSLGYSVREDRQVARLVAQLTPPGSRILVFGARCSVYLWSHREPASRFFFNFPLVLPSDGPVSPGYRKEYLEVLSIRPPAVLLVPSSDIGIYDPVSSLELAQRWPGLRDLLQKHYRPGPQAEGFRVYLLAGPAR
ncbi:MAG: hypothetical protein HY303_02975 [Candidatus Wallbacteria bacterium]|nr:hypothetical protein [Candidatus Wallbacteria bacterium]